MSGTSSGSSTTAGVTLTIDPDPGFDLSLDELTGVEELGRPFVYQLSLSSSKAKTDLTSMLGSSVTVKLVDSSGNTRYFNGLIGRIAYAGMRSGARRYRVELRPWLWLLSHQMDCRIFQGQTVFDIITGICRSAGFSAISDKRGGDPKAGSQTLDYCVQYDETSLDFITRLMEEYGIYYYFEHADGNHTVVFCDDPSSHTALATAIPFQTRQSSGRAVKDYIWQWSSELAVVAGKVAYEDYNFTTSTVDLTARSSTSDSTYKYASYELFEYPGRYGTTSDGQKLTDVRIQNLGVRQRIMFGTSNSRLLYAGCKFTLSGFYEDSDNTEYTMIRATYSLAVSEKRGGSAGATRDVFRCVFQAIKGTTPFRLSRITPCPRIRGPQTAKVVTEPTGSASDEVVTDQYGRVKVLFPWARPTPPADESQATQDETSAQNAQKASCWIRVAQVWAGVSWGAIFIPRVGQEVVVEFLEGDPDRPLITGCVYNDKQTVPYALPDNKTRSTIKTNSSTGGNGYNELRFEDKAGSEEVYFQAQKDYNKVVLNNETVNITQDTTTTVKQGNRSVTVSQGDNSLTVSQGKNSVTVSQGDNSLTVSQGKNTVTVQSDNSLTVNQGNNSVTVSTGSDSLTVSTGNHSITVSTGTSTISATQGVTIKSDQNVTLQVGANSITLSTTGISISGIQISGSADTSMSLNGGASMSLQAGEISIN
jgi:type VI secretion system secreted protein VgrG